MTYKDYITLGYATAAFIAFIALIAFGIFFLRREVNRLREEDLPVIRCKKCGQKNRIKKSTGIARCGDCRQPLTEMLH